METSKTGTPAPERYSTHREVHSIEALPRLAIPILFTLRAAKLLLHLFTSVRHYGSPTDKIVISNVESRIPISAVPPILIV